MAAGDWKGVFSIFDPLGAVGSIAAGNVVNYTMPTANNAWCGRFIARSTKDIKSVVVSFAAVSSPGTVTARIETIDATTGKPTGTLYDANATKSFTPSTGINTITFGTLPTTGLTVGTEYGLVLIKDDTGTSCSLRGRVGANALPGTCLTASDGSTRSNFAEVGNSIAVGCLINEDDEYVASNLSPAYINSFQTVYGADRVAAMKIVTSVDLSITAVVSAQGVVYRTGTPAGDLRVRVLDTGNSVVSSLSWTIDKDSLANSNSRGLYLPTNGAVSLPAGTYKIALDSPDSVSNLNCFGMRYSDLWDASLQPNGWCFSVSTDASTSFTWTDTTSRTCPIGFEVDDVVASGGTGAVIINHGITQSGIRSF